MDRFIGRTGERELTREWIDRLPETGGAIVITGEAGIGKTAFIDVAVSEAKTRGVRVVTLTATESEVSLPYAALQQIVYTLGPQSRSLRPRPKDVLDRAFGQIGGATPDLFAVGVAVLELLADVDPDSGLLLLVDDAQWLDEATARVLSFASRRLTDDPVLAIFAVRSGHPSPLLSAGLQVIEFAGLTDDDALELLRMHRPSLAAREQHAVLRNAQGNPLGLLELSGRYSREDEGTLAERLRSAFLTRLHGVGVGTRTLLLLAALNESDTIAAVEASGDAFGLAAADIRTAFREAEGTGTVDVATGRVVFRHPLVRSAIVSSALESERRSAHAAIADALRNDPDRAVWHRAASLVGVDEEVASMLEEVGIRADRQRDFAASVRAWGLAAHLSMDGSARIRRSLRLAVAAMEAGRSGTAAEALATVDRSALDLVEAGRFALVQLGIDTHVVSARELRRTVELATRILRAGETDMAIELVLAVGEDLSAGGIDAKETLSELAHEIADALPDSDPKRLVVLYASDPALYGGRVAEAVLSMSIAELDETTELLARIRINVDADPVMAAMQRHLLARYRVQGRLRSIVFLQPIHGWNEICLADWPEALRAFEEGTRLAAELGLPRWGTGTMIGEGFIAAMRGDHARAEALVLESEQGAVAAGAHNVLTGVQLTRGINHLAQAQYEEAFTAFRRCFDPADPSYHPIQSGWCLGDLAEAAAHLGRIEEIRPLFLREAEQSMTPWRQMAESYAAPFLADDPASVEAAFLDALSGIVARWPTYQARLLIEYGSWLRRQRRIRDARERLRTARDQADALAMRPWSERVRSELRALGADSPPRIPEAWEPLSPQELEVAQLAERGLSNREIGERMFISHRTVGSHLYRIYPKLGITNRAQLSSALRSSDN